VSVTPLFSSHVRQPAHLQVARHGKARVNRGRQALAQGQGQVSGTGRRAWTASREGQDKTGSNTAGGAGIDDRQGRPKKRGSSLLRTAANSPAGFVVGYQVKLSRNSPKCSKTSPQRNLLFGGRTGTGCVSRVGFGSGSSSSSRAAATTAIQAGCLEMHTAAI
jgi:hypothetical protein